MTDGRKVRMKGSIPAVQDDPAVPGRKRSGDEVTAGLFSHVHRHGCRALAQVAVSAPELTIINDTQVRMAAFFGGKMQGVSHRLQDIMSE